MKTEIVTIEGASLAPTTARREPSRPAQYRDASFNSKFDHSTLAYDAVFVPSERKVRIIAPALLNLHDNVQGSTLRSAGGSRSHPFEIRTLDRQSQILVDADENPQHLVLEGPLGRCDVRVHAEQQDLFEGHRVLFSLSKNNNLQWIKDWARYYRDLHGATAILFYDNNSDYDARDIARAIDDVGGYALAVIVRWPFRHGPPGSGLRRHWDSNFSQLGVMEHARWRFLAKAASVLNCDVDELVVSRRGNSIFEAVEASKAGVIAFYGDWVFGIAGDTREPTPTAPMRFRDYRYVLRNLTAFRYGVLPTKPMRCKSKWAVVPGRVPSTARWHIHYIEGWLSSRLKSMDFRFRHYREISTSWKYDRTDRVSFDPSLHELDDLMLTGFVRLGWITEHSALRSRSPDMRKRQNMA